VTVSSNGIGSEMTPSASSGVQASLFFSPVPEQAMLNAAAASSSVLRPSEDPKKHII
jgi:hypothetical protein